VSKQNLLELVEQKSRRRITSTLLGGVSALAICSLASTAPAFAQDAAVAPAEQDVIVVTGIRGSLQRAMDIKRDANGIVDAISAEDIGNFPDTNLAESLQRITGVSINRVNGEGSLVTVRGFGSGFNMVTLNGRTMPTSNIAIIGTDQSGDFATGSSRSFDFSNLASEGVSGLEVYKTSRSDIPSGGIGATINILTNRPFDNPGMRGVIGAKIMNDTSVEFSGDEFTPELSGLFSWTDPSERFGVSLFGSFQERNAASVSATSNNWNIESFDSFSNTANGRVNGATVITNPPPGSQLVSFPNDSRYHLAEAERERINGQLTFQFRPIDTLTLTADYTYANSQTTEQRTDQTNWFNRPFAQVTFDDNPVVATSSFLQENIAGVKDMGFEQQYRAVETTLESFGFNGEWEVNDRLTLSVDAHTSTSETSPNSPNGASSTLFSMGAPVIAAHSLDISSGFPVQNFTIDDAQRGNANGVLDVGDLGSQIARTNTSFQEHALDEIRFDASWEVDGGMRFDVGADYRTSKMTQRRVQTQQTLGDWGLNNPGDIEQFAPGLVEQYCLSCLFDDYTPGNAQIAFKASAVELNDLLSAAYAGMGNAVNETQSDFNVVEEDILGLYAQFTWEGDWMNMPTTLATGIRYEETQVASTALVSVPQAIVWLSDNDFTTILSSTVQPVADEGEYTNLMPSVDLKIELMPDLIGRISYSETIARPSYGNLFVADDSNTPPRPTAFGGIATGSTGDAGLLPLQSDNIDISLEWYFDDSSMLSVSFFDKKVENFIGTGQSTRNLFGLRDPSSGNPGTRSGDALTELGVIGADPTDVNLFTLTALIDQMGSIAAASAVFQANFAGGFLNQAFIDSTFGAYDVTPNASDPLFGFEVQGPINNREGSIHGIEFALQHFFGDTGFGFQANYTMVDGDVTIDVGADPSVDQFALLGLSDTANFTAIYEKYGFSARVAYNWRDEYLASTNRGGGNRNPVFNEAFGQVDLNVSYDVTETLQFSFEAINLTGENLRTFGRDNSNFWFVQELDPRYLLGARYRF